MCDSSVKISFVFLDKLEVVQQTMSEEKLPFFVLATIDKPEL